LMSQRMVRTIITSNRTQKSPMAIIIGPPIMGIEPDIIDPPSRCAAAG
jgi:hypothetical protein